MWPACPVGGGEVGGDPGPHTSLGVFLGIKAAVKRALGKDSLDGLHIALQGAGSVAGGVARQAAAEGARLSIADVDRAGPRQLAAETGGAVVTPDDILCPRRRRGQPLRARRDPDRAVDRPAQRADCRGRRQQPAGDGGGWPRLQARGILYAPDYVINAGGIINVSTEYLGDGGPDLVRSRIEAIPGRLEQIWAESAATGPRSGVRGRRHGPETDRALIVRLIEGRAGVR